MQHRLEPVVVRRWCALALDALRGAITELDAINVFPVADGDTGTNLCHTMEAAARELRAASVESAGAALHAMSHGALLGACGNSGTILAQLFRGMAQEYTTAEQAPAPPGVAPCVDPASQEHVPLPEAAAGGAVLRRALARAVTDAYEAVARPAEGTILTVAAAAVPSGEASNELLDVARDAHSRARTALRATTDQLPALARAGVVDAGGQGLVLVLGALVEALSTTRHGAGNLEPDGAGEDVDPGAQEPYRPEHVTVPDGCAEMQRAADPAAGVAYEVMYLLRAPERAVQELRAKLGELGDSLVVVGGDALWSVHLHTGDVGAAVEAGIDAGRPHRIRVAPLEHPESPGRVPDSGADPAVPDGDAVADATARVALTDEGAEAESSHAVGGLESDALTVARVVVAMVPGEGLTELCTAAGATVLRTDHGVRTVAGALDVVGTAAPPDDTTPNPVVPGVDACALAAAVRRTQAPEVVLLPNEPGLRDVAVDAAERLRAVGVRVAVIPTRAVVQGLAALAVHDPEARFDEDVVAMTAASGATRYGEVIVAGDRSWTTAGICQAGDALGLVDGDVALIGNDIEDAATGVLDRMLAAGGELVTLVCGARTPPGLTERLTARVRAGHLAVDTVVYDGRQPDGTLLIGVE